MSNLPKPERDLQIDRRFPPSLRGTIYQAMIEAIAEETSLWRDAMKKQKMFFYDIDKVDKERLIEICKIFEIPFVTVSDELSYLKEEVRAIPFKILYKGTPLLYKSFFYAIDRYGEVFVYIYHGDTDTIERSMEEPFQEASCTPQNLPFRHRSKGDFSGVIISWLRLDSGKYLDANGKSSWRLDTSLSEISTNHIGLEYFIDSVIKRNGNDYLMTKEYLDYITQNIEFARRVKEVPHVGSQLSIQSDTSGLCNSFDPTSEYSIPKLKLKVVTRPDFFEKASSLIDIAYMDFGIGKNEVASVTEPEIDFPVKLESKIYSVSIPLKNKLSNVNYVGVVGEYVGQTMGDFEILDGSQINGTQKIFSFVLPFFPIKRGNIVLKFNLPNDGLVYEVTDDYRGSLLSSYGKGVIDYETGECKLSTDFEYPLSVDMEEGVSPNAFNGGRTVFSKTLTDNEPLIPEKIYLTFTVDQNNNPITYRVGDTRENNASIGNFVHPFIDTGTINYLTKKIDIKFKVPLVGRSIKPFRCDYSIHIDYLLPEGTSLTAFYYFTQSMVPITEIGLRNNKGELLSYATFPPFEFPSSLYHLSFMLLIKKFEVLREDENEENVNDNEPESDEDN